MHLRYKELEIQEYTINEQSRHDQDLIEANLTGDYSKIIEVVND